MAPVLNDLTIVLTRITAGFATLLLAGALQAQAGSPVRVTPEPPPAELMRALESRVGVRWVGVGATPGLGTFESERRFRRSESGTVVIHHVMKERGRTVARDSMAIRPLDRGATLDGRDSQGQVVRATLVQSPEPGAFVFETPADWRCVFKDFREGSFVMEFYMWSGKSWTLFLRTAYNSVPPR